MTEAAPQATSTETSTGATAHATADRISARRRVAAPAAVIFAIVASPQGHVDIDGSGMLIAAPDAAPLTAVGDTFAIHMDRRPLGDVPDMAEYDVQNTVSQIEPNALFEWTPGMAGRNPVGHRYGYALTPVSDQETDVESYCDWSALSDKWRARVSWPVVPVSALQKSLDNLARISESI
ncbi:MAG: hypothetical protein JWO63_738 [Frankiales bacterium]|nr:hypothetical protein [Frankiales bacterium]